MTKTATRKGVAVGQASVKPKQKATKAKKPAKSKGGRPTLFDPAYIDQVRRLAMLGQTDEEMADFFGVSLRAFANWKVRHKGFVHALKEGKANADAMVAASLYHRALGYSHKAVKIMQYEGCPVVVPYTEHYAPDTAACIFWLKNRQRGKWRDKVESEISGPDGGPIQQEITTEPTDAMLEAFNAKLLAHIGGEVGPADTAPKA